MMNIVVDKSTDQECRFIKLNMAEEFVATLVGITVQLYFLKFQGHWLLVKSGTIYSYHILYSKYPRVHHSVTLIYLLVICIYT